LAHALSALGYVDERFEGDSATALGVLAEAKAILANVDESQALEERIENAVTTSMALVSSGKYDEADAALKDALAFAVRAGTSETLDGAQIYFNLGRLRAWSGHLSEALAAYEHAFAIFLRILGPDHYLTFGAEGNVASMLTYLDQLDRAEIMFRDVIERSRRVLGEKHMSYARALDGLAIAETMLQRYDSALAHLQSADDICLSTGATDHPVRGDIMLNMGRAYLGAKNYSAALKKFDQALEFSARTLPPDHPFSPEPMMLRAQTLVRLERKTEALPAAEKALALCRDKYGMDSVVTIEALFTAGLARAAAGDRANARAVLREALDVGARVYGAQSPRLVNLRAEIAKIMQVD